MIQSRNKIVFMGMIQSEISSFAFWEHKHFYMLGSLQLFFSMTCLDS